MITDWKAVLDSRENRAERQQKWLREYKIPLVSFTLNIPGPSKQSELYTRIHEEGLNALSNRIPLHRLESLHLATGSEAILNTFINSFHLKFITVDLEEHHPLGRIFDMDVIDQNGRHISRSDMNLPPRRCLICNDEARICARNKIHRLEDLLERIFSISARYFRGSDTSILNAELTGSPWPCRTIGELNASA